MLHAGWRLPAPHRPADQEPLTGAGSLATGYRILASAPPTAPWKPATASPNDSPRRSGGRPVAARPVSPSDTRCETALNRLSCRGLAGRGPELHGRLAAPDGAATRRADGSERRTARTGARCRVERWSLILVLGRPGLVR